MQFSILQDGTMSIQTLLDFIGKYESRGDYGVVWGGVKSEDRPKNLTEVLKWQRFITAKKRYKSSAAGKYQVIRKTLMSVYTSAGFSVDDAFNAACQDRIAISLLERRGLLRYQEGTIKTETFANNIAREWASMPVVSGVNAGKSYYARDGVNKAHASIDDFLAAVRASKNYST